MEHFWTGFEKRAFLQRMLASPIVGSAVNKGIQAKNWVKANPGKTALGLGAAGGAVALGSKMGDSMDKPVTRGDMLMYGRGAAFR